MVEYIPVKKGLNIHKDDPHYEKKKEIAMQNVVKTTEAVEGDELTLNKLKNGKNRNTK